MNNKPYTQQLFLALLVGSVLTLLAVSVALADGSIDPTNKYAWGTNTGWINFAPTNGGVTIYSDHLEGDAWGENIGWIRLKGTARDSMPYGVNNDGVGNLSGYAWGTNVGWINFKPTNGGVWVDPVTGNFEGYAWGENVGWIHFQNSSGNAYTVTTGWHGDLTPTYTNNITAVITARYPGAASSSGLTVTNSSFLHEAGDGIIFGHNNIAFAVVTDHLTGSNADQRWARIWQLDVNDEDNDGGNVALTFDISEAGGRGNFDNPGDYFLLKRDAGSTADFTTVSVSSTTVLDDQLTFIVDVSQLGSEFTLGAKAGAPTAVTMRDLTAAANASPGVIGVAFASLAAVGALTVVLRRKRQG